MNSTRGKREKIGRMVEMFAKEANPIEEARAGDIIALVSLAETETGDTLCDSANPVVLERMRFPDPVISVSVEGEDQGASRRSSAAALGKMVRADPSLHLETDRETGQTILRGMGELHLEVTLDRMRTEFGVEGTMGEPQVAYRETIHQEGRRAVHPQEADRRLGPVRRSVDHLRAAASAAPDSSSSTRPSAARCRRNSCRRSRRACSMQKEDGVLAQLSDRGFPRDADRRQLPRRRLERADLRDRGQGLLPRGACARPGRSCSSR